MEERYLITGAAGQLGNALQLAWGGPDGDSVPRAHEAFDITNREHVFDWLPSIKPAVVINCAAHFATTRADLLERQPYESWKVNAQGVAHLAAVCASLDVPLIHFSTDQVFGVDDRAAGFSRSTPYTETCDTGPRHHHGWSKMAGEYAILRQAADNPTFRYYIIRTANLFEDLWRESSNQPFAIARELLRKRRNSMSVPYDCLYNVTRVTDLVRAVQWIVTNHGEWSSKSGPIVPKGIYHITNRGTCSNYELAARIARNLGHSEKVQACTLAEDCSRRDVSPNLRTSYTCLATDKYEALVGAPVMPNWQEAVDAWCRKASSYFNRAGA